MHIFSKGTTIMLIPINFCNLNVNKVYAKMLAVNHKGIDFSAKED